jgi:hypothetical protein
MRRRKIQMNTIDEIRKKVDDLTDKAFNTGYEAGYANGMKVAANNLPRFLEWLNSEVAIIGKDQDGKTHILVARRVQEDPEKLVWADAVQEFNLRNETLTSAPVKSEITPEMEKQIFEGKDIISSDGSEVSE